MGALCVVADTTKVRIFKQITTIPRHCTCCVWLLLIPQRYEFSSKSQPYRYVGIRQYRCCWYHKGTNFQANHNRKRNATKWSVLLLIPQRYEFSSKSQLQKAIKGDVFVVADTTKVRIFKQITTSNDVEYSGISCCWYHKGTNFQANHNLLEMIVIRTFVVADTTKVRIFKQITT